MNIVEPMAIEHVINPDECTERMYLIDLIVEREKEQPMDPTGCKAWPVSSGIDKNIVALDSCPKWDCAYDDGDIDMGMNDNKNHNLKIDTNMNADTTPPLLNMPASPRLMCDGRTVCQYDEKCYRKNMDHLKRFKHP
eukprot:15313_1